MIVQRLSPPPQGPAGQGQGPQRSTVVAITKTIIKELESTRRQHLVVWRWDIALFAAVALFYYYEATHQRGSRHPSSNLLQANKSSSLCSSNTTRQLYESQEVLKTYKWEWVLVRIDELANLPLESLGTDLPDPQVSLRVHAALPQDILFSGDLATFTWPTLWNTPSNTSNIKGLGIAAYLQGTATSIEIAIAEKNQVNQDYVLLNQTLMQLPETDLDDWTRYSLHQDGISVSFSMKRMTRPLYTEQDHDDMDLTERLLNLEKGELASLAFKIHPQNSKAVLYLAGRSDSFAHPHVLNMYASRGYDFYALDVRRSGRARRFLKNPYLGNDVTDFKDLVEDVDLALQYIHAQKNYTETVAHCHSNGALVLFSYLLHQRDLDLDQSPGPIFDGYVLNAPFLAWGHVGGSLNEWVLKNAAMINSVYPQQLWGHDGLNDWWTKIWLLYRWNLTWKPVITNSLTSHYAEAVSRVHQQILDLGRGTYLLGEAPTLVLSSQSDDVLQHDEILRLASELHPHPTLVEFDWHSHDVTKSLTHDLNAGAIFAISEWLEDLERCRRGERQ